MTLQRSRGLHGKAISSITYRCYTTSICSEIHGTQKITPNRRRCKVLNCSVYTATWWANRKIPIWARDGHMASREGFSSFPPSQTQAAPILSHISLSHSLSRSLMIRSDKLIWLTHLHLPSATNLSEIPKSGQPKAPFPDSGFIYIFQTLNLASVPNRYHSDLFLSIFYCVLVGIRAIGQCPPISRLFF